MTTTLAGAIPALAEHPEQPFHPADQIRLRSFQQQVEMVAHQHPGMHPPAVAFAGFAQTSEKSEVVCVGFENPFAAVTACHDVVNRARILDS
jgi:hypothetical protein